VTFSGKDVTKNVTSSKIYFRVRERHIQKRVLKDFRRVLKDFR